MPESGPTEKFDIVIVGGGIVGRTLALSLLREGRRQGSPSFTIALLTGEIPPAAPGRPGTGVSAFDPRVSALTPGSQRLFESLGLWETMAAKGICPYREMFVWDGEGTGSIHFEALEIQQDNLGHIVENEVITSALHNALLASEQITLIEGDALTAVTEQAGPDTVRTLSLASGRDLQCRLLLGADGANSFVRENSGFQLKAWDYGHQAIVTTVRTQLPHAYTARQCFLPKGPLAFLPLLNPVDHAPDKQVYSSIVWSCQPEQARELAALDDEAFRRALTEAFEHKLGAVVEAAPRHSFPLWQRHARDYVKPGVALVGDAAHTIHPLAGQGVNLGLRDAAVLSEILCAAALLGENFAGERVLSRYQRRRKGENLGMMVVMEAFKRGFESDSLLLRWLRNTGLDGTDRMLPIKRQLMQLAVR